MLNHTDVRRVFPLGLLLLTIVATRATAQDETPTIITDQNRSGELPFTTSIGNSVESVDIVSGNPKIQIPIVSIPGRGLTYSFGLRYDSAYWASANRFQAGTGNYQIWNVEKRPWTPTNGLGWATNVPTSSHVTTSSSCPPNGPQASLNWHYMFTDAQGAKHPVMVQHGGDCLDNAINDNPEPDTSYAGMLASLSGVTLADGTTNSCGFGSTWCASIRDANGNKISLGTFTDTLGRAIVTQQNGTNQILYKVYDSSGTLRTYTVNYTSINVATSFNVSGLYGTLIREFSGPRNVVTSVVLPNGRSYSFQYETGSYGGLSRVTFPTGAYVSYTWGTFLESDRTHRYITSRILNVDGQSYTWNISRVCAVWNGPYCSQIQTTVTDPLGNQSVYQSQKGAVTLAQIYQGAATGSPLRQFAIDYMTGTEPVGNDLAGVPIRVTTALENGLVSKKEFDYEWFTFAYSGCSASLFCAVGLNGTTTRGDVTEIREYDWGQGSPGSLRRRTDKTYLHAGNSNYLVRNIVDKVLLDTVYDGSGNQVAQTQYEYDCYASCSNTLLSTSGAPQHDYTGYGSSFIYRGNATRVRRWRNTDGALLATNYQYDDLGNIRTITDPLAHSTSYLYNDSFANAACPPAANSQAWVSQVTSAANQRIQVVRYPCTGLVQAHKDENDILAGRSGTTFTYDLLGRPTQRNFADGGQVATSYNDVPPVSFTSTTKITPTLNLVNTTIQDGLGRAIQSKLTSDPEGTVFVDTTYDLLGRKRTVSNPYRSTGDPTYGLTTTNYDALDRVTSVVEADNSTVATSYAGNCTTVTDEANKARKSCSDALGRLTQVFEDPSVLNYETDYQYDALDNLTRVDQKGSSPGNSANWRTRTFTYSSLSQLLTASNPESGSINYTYNNDGQVLTRVAPKPNQIGSLTATTTYSYDNLHRLAQKSYNDGTTATAKFGYDGVALSGCTTAPPALTDGNPKGYRTSMCDGSGATSWSHDPMGRVLTEKRTVVGSSPWTKTAAYTYNEDGSIASISNPGIGRLISYTTSGAGRQTGVINSGGGLNFVKWATYAPFGGLTSSTNGYGTAAPVTVTNTYNTHLQPITISASTSSATILSLSYDFHLGAGDNGNVFQVVNNRASSRTQNFVYDSLNRIKQAYTNGSNWGEDFTIDAWGDLTNRNSIAGKNNPEPLNAAPATTKNQLNGYCHDSAGNLALNAPCPQGTLYPEYTYDAENRLNSASGFTYVYDGDGHRVKKTDGSSGTLYWPDLNGNTLTEANLGATNLHEYIYFGGKRVARIDVPAPLSVKYYFSDHLGSANVIVDDTGAVVKEADFYPYGGERWVSGTDSNGYKFTGKERDSESGLDNFGARMYANTMGRFLTPDRPFADQHLRDPQSWNLYSYVTNNPLRFVDPTGTVKRDATGQIIFAPQGRVDTKFTNGDPRRGTVQPGYIQADNGAKIKAYQQVGGSNAYKCDCHGLTFGDGKYWINNDQANKLLKGDGYEKTKTPQPGDVAIFKANGEVVHSLTVTGVDDKGKVNEVTGLGGTEPASHSNTPEQIQQQFGQLLDTNVTVEYYHDPNPDRPTQEKLDQVKNYEKPKDQPKEEKK